MTKKSFLIQKNGSVARKMAYYIMILEVNTSACRVIRGSSRLTKLFLSSKQKNRYTYLFYASKIKKVFLISYLLNTMNKQSIVEAVHEKLGGTKVAAEQAVETMIDTITGGLKKGDEVSIAGLGIFSVKTRAARTARNPRTGEAIKVAAMRVPKFRAAKALKDAVK